MEFYKNYKLVKEGKVWKLVIKVSDTKEESHTLTPDVLERLLTEYRNNKG
ncbi:hypothetical protein [Vibrio phage VCPH]|nr:hypothetical protein [Vibrio phage VCPH]